ncbi:MAG: alkaline phosphatase family protein [Rhizomicrobium sp.]
MTFAKVSSAVFCAILAGSFIASPGAAKKAKLPKPDHIIIVMEENHSYDDIIGSAQAPYINSLAQSGASFTDSHAITHPSQPNYLELFSGSTQGVKDDSCPHSFDVDNEASQLIAAGKSFVGYSEGLPGEGSLVCTAGEYARKHSPWTNFTNLPVTTNEPYTAYPKKLKKLPVVSWVIPNLLDDMHDGTIAQGDTWLKNNLAAYVTWATTHNSLLIVTWDEDDGSQSNQIPTIFVGPMVKQGQYSEHITHDNVLATIEAMYGLAPARQCRERSADQGCLAKIEGHQS